MTPNARYGEVFKTLKGQNNWTVFFLSVILCSILLVLERLAGIGWSFHPDSATYVNNNIIHVKDIIQSGSPTAYLSQFYFFISYALRSNVFALVTLNVLAFAFTNMLIFDAIKNRVLTRLQLVSLMLLIFYPYRVHLAVHVLKDTLVVLFLVLAVVKSRAFVLPLVLMTMRAALYLPVFFPRILNVLWVVLGFLAYFLEPRVVEFVYRQALMDFSFRSADQVPVFADVEYGVLVRMLVWPLLYLTGGFFFTSPTLLMLPLAISQVLSQLAAISLFSRPLCTFGFFVSLALVALMTPGFTTYYRYALPIFTIMPLLINVNDKK